MVNFLIQPEIQATLLAALLAVIGWAFLELRKSHQRSKSNANAKKVDPAPVVPVAKKSTLSKTFVHNLPFASNPFFTGRDKMLDDLRAALFKKTAAAITQPQAVHGLGGVGKTQLAVEYGWKYQADYDVVLWAGAGSPSELHANLASLADVLKLPETDVREQEIKVRAVVDWLRSNQRWLLILDNADTKDAQAAVQKMLPVGLQGHVIVTSRLTNWSIKFADIEVKVLPVPFAAEFLQHRSAKTGFNAGNKIEAEAVVNELGCLPLALEQAGAYIARHRVSFVEYLRLLNASLAKLLAAGSDGGTDYQKTVATTWLVSEEQLSLAARALLQIVAFLAPDEIPRALFMENGKVLAVGIALLAQEFSSDSIEPIEKVKIDDALAELAEHSLIDLDAEAFSCHRLLQAVLLDRLIPSDRILWSQLAVRTIHVYSPQPPDDVGSWTIWNKLRSHLRILFNIIGNEADTEAAALMNQFGLYLYTQSLYAEAEPLFWRALAIDEKIRGSEHPEVATRLNNLAQIFKETNRLKEAEPLYRRALKIVEKSFGPQHTKVAVLLNNLAQLLVETNHLTEAEPFMRRGLTIEETNRGLDHHCVAIQLSNLALLLQGTNRLPEAEPLMRRALAIEEKNFGLEHPSVSTCLNNLAVLLRDTNRQTDAEQHFRRALAIDEKFFKPENPRLATRLSNLALLLKDTNRLAEAEPLMRRALDIDEKTFGPDHSKVATDLNNLAQLLQKTNRHENAELFFRRALAIDEKNYGSSHPNVAVRLTNLAAMLKETNRLPEAEPLMRRSVTIFEKSLGENHPNVAIALNNLALLLYETHRLKEAEPLSQRAVSIYVHSFGLEHTNTKIALNAYKGILSDMKLSEPEIQAKLRAVMGQ